MPYLHQTNQLTYIAISISYKTRKTCEKINKTIKNCYIHILLIFLTKNYIIEIRDNIFLK